MKSQRISCLSSTVCGLSLTLCVVCLWHCVWSVSSTVCGLSLALCVVCLWHCVWSVCGTALCVVCLWHCVWFVVGSQCYHTVLFPTSTLRLCRLSFVSVEHFLRCVTMPSVCCCSLDAVSMLIYQRSTPAVSVGLCSLCIYDISSVLSQWVR